MRRISSGILIVTVVGLAVGVVMWRNQRAAGLTTDQPPSINTHAKTETIKPPPNDPTPPAVSEAVRLRASQGPLSGVFPLPLPTGALTLYVGRDPKACQVVFGNQHDQVGRIHCLFSWTPQTRVLTVKDLSSSNGTFVNGTRIQASEPVTLKAGDMVDLGGSGINRFTVEFA